MKVFLSVDHANMNNMMSSMSQMSLRGKGTDHEVARNAVVGQQENNNGNQMVCCSFLPLPPLTLSTRTSTCMTI